MNKSEFYRKFILYVLGASFAKIPVFLAQLKSAVNFCSNFCARKFEINVGLN